MEWKTVRIFISSTFNDMHAERDFLVKYVFPELSVWCRDRKLRLIDIDLRWGVSAADAKANNTVMACLNNIDESRPFFLCFLGQRRGWIPESKDISENTYENYPGIKEYVEKSSVTEMEIEHALLSPMLCMVDEKYFNPQPVKHALFFFRKDPFSGNILTDVQKSIYTNAGAQDPLLADAQLSKFKEKIRSRWNVCDYDCYWDKDTLSPELYTEGSGAVNGRLINFMANGIPLKDVIIEALKKEIEKEFPDNCPVDNKNLMETELEQQEHFIYQCSEGFIARENDLRVLNEYVLSNSRKPFILTAEAGLGKTTLLANFVLIVGYFDKCITARFCGASDLSSSLFGLWKSIFEQHGILYKEDIEEIKKDIYNLLSQISGVLIIDGINQLPKGIDMLSWLPHELPEGLKLIISLKDDEYSNSAIKATSQYAIIHKIEPFSSFDDKISLINEYLKHYLKKLDENHIDIICEAKGSENPLFLKIILSSLRVFGAFKQLESEIFTFGNNPISAFKSVLSGLEHDTSYITVLPSGKCVPLLFGLLACARRGLTEDELAFCFKQEFVNTDEETIRCALRVYIRRVRAFIASREGRVDFLYESFRIAVNERYKENIMNNHKLLATCFASICDPKGIGEYTSKEPRALSELAYHLCQSDASLGEEILCNCAYLNARCSASGSGELISDYDMLPYLNPNINRFRSFLIRFSDTFSKYKNSFFSTALSCNFDEAKDMINALNRSNSYIYPEQINTPPYNHSFTSISEIPIKITASYKLDKTVSVCVPKRASFAIFSEGIGRLRLIYMDTMNVDEKVIITSSKRPMDIFATDRGDYIAITFEDETAEIIQLNFEEGRFIASYSVTIFNYYLPMLSDAVFAFGDDFLWYQKDMYTMAKLSRKGESIIALPEEGDITAIGENINVFALRTLYGGKLCLLDNENVKIVKEFPDKDLLSIVILKSGDLVISLSDATVRLFDCNFNEKGYINTGISCTLLLEIEKGILCIGERSRKAFFWDLKDSLQTSELSEFEYNRKISASYYGGLIQIISDQHVLTASVTVDTQLSAFLISVFFDGDDIIQVFRENSNKITVQRFTKTVIVPLESEKLSLLKIKNELFIFDIIGNMAIVDLINMTVQKGIAKFRPVSVAGAMDGYYCIDTAGFLHHFPNDIKLPSLSEYMLSSVSLRVVNDLLILTGISTNARAGIANTPYLLLLFKIGEGGSLIPICERYFPKDRGMFIDSCFNEADNRLYVFFSTPYSGSSITIPTVSFGTVDEFINNQEKQMEIYFERKNNSFCAFDNVLFICGGGVISAYETNSLKHLASIASEGGFRLIIPRSNNLLLALSGSSDVYVLQQHN